MNPLSTKQSKGGLTTEICPGAVDWKRRFHGAQEVADRQEKVGWGLDDGGTRTLLWRCHLREAWRVARDVSYRAQYRRFLSLRSIIQSRPEELRMAVL